MLVTSREIGKRCNHEHEEWVVCVVCGSLLSGHQWPHDFPSANKSGSEAKDDLASAGGGRSGHIRQFGFQSPLRVQLGESSRFAECLLQQCRGHFFYLHPVSRVIYS